MTAHPRRLLLGAGLAALAAVGIRAQQQPVFRGEIDVIRLDVSVLDRNRHPVLGLKAEDFTVLENGKVQRIVAVTAIEAIEHDPAPSAWMRYARRDVSTNDLIDEAGDGRLFAIIIDDWNIPWDDAEIPQGARMAARYVVDSLGPSDVAAVIYTQAAGRTQDFTNDRQKLLRAIDAYHPTYRPWVYPRPEGPGPGGGDMPQRFSPTLMRTECQRRQPLVPTIDLVTSRLAAIPNRRKTVILITVGIPFNFSAVIECPGELAHIMRMAFLKARRGNINLYGVDPAEYNGYTEYLQRLVRKSGAPSRRVVPHEQARDATRRLHEFLEIIAENTGGRAVLGMEGIQSGIDRIFAEDGSYYLVGYQSSTGKPDGKFRRIQVKVNRPDVTVRTRSGYWALPEGTLDTIEERDAPGVQDLGLSGLMPAPALPLRASAVPLSLASTGGPEAEIGIILTLRAPPTATAIDEPLTVVHNVYVDGDPGPPVKQELPLTVYPSGDDTRRYDAFTRLTLPPGRYDIRLNAHSRVLDKSGSVFAEVEVPDFTRDALSMSGVALGTKRVDGDTRATVLDDLLPIVPTSARDFAPSDQVTAFFRVFQGGASEVQPITLRILLLDMTNKTIVDRSETLAIDRFGAGRVVTHQIDMPLNGLTRGPHVFSVTAKLSNGTSERRDVVFRIR